jgi:hypothetical protein
MSGARYDEEKTSEARLAAVVMLLLKRVEQRNIREGTAHMVDYADLEEHLRPFVQRELLNARLDELHTNRYHARHVMDERQEQLQRELYDVQREIAQRI